MPSPGRPEQALNAMLTSLSIRDIVLIERLDLELEAGLCVLTGETGAGKSILLDSLGLALGGRADRGLVRAGAKQGSVSAAFQLDRDADAIELASRRSRHRGRRPSSASPHAWPGRPLPRLHQRPARRHRAP